MRYEYISTLKASEKGDICLVRDENGVSCVKRYRTLDRALLQRLMAVRCPCIAAVLSVGEDENGAYTIEEYIEGTPASEVQLTAAQAVNVLLDLCKALKALHRNGIVHRDVKPSNMIVGKDGHAHLIDFDVARLTKEYQGHDTGYLGTIGYAPPEQYGFMQTDCRSDIYAFGRTMEELLGEASDRPRFRGIIRRCTAFDPENRYSDILFVERALNGGRAIVFAAVACVLAAAAVAVCVVLATRSDTSARPEVSGPLESSNVTESHLQEQDETAPAYSDEESSEQAEPNSAERVVSVQTADTGAEQTEAEESVVAPSQESAFAQAVSDEAEHPDTEQHVFCDDPAVHGRWRLYGTSRDGQHPFATSIATIEGYDENYMIIQEDGTIQLYSTGLKDLGTMRWTKGFCIDERSGSYVLEMYVKTEGRELLYVERPPSEDGSYPHMYIVYEKI